MTPHARSTQITRYRTSIHTLSPPPSAVEPLTACTADTGPPGDHRSPCSSFYLPVAAKLQPRKETRCRPRFLSGTSVRVEASMRPAARSRRYSPACTLYPVPKDQLGPPGNFLSIRANSITVFSLGCGSLDFHIEIEKRDEFSYLEIPNLILIKIGR